MLLTRRKGDPDLQAGSTGLSPLELARQFFRSPGQVLALLRTTKGLDVETVAKSTLVPAERIHAYEIDADEPTPQHIVALATFYEADLHILAQVLGVCGETSGC